MILLVAMYLHTKTLFAAEWDPSSLIPIGTVTGMLVAIAVLFFKDSARNDQRADLLAAREVARMNADNERLREEMAAHDAECAQRLAAERENSKISKKFLYDRIAALETLLYNEVRTVEPPDVH